MDKFSVIAIAAFLLTISSFVVPNGAASPTCQQALDNCSNEFAKGAMNCDNAHKFQTCVDDTFPICSSNSQEQSLYYGTFSASQSNIDYICKERYEQAQAYSTATVETQATFLTCAMVSLASLYTSLIRI